MDFGFRIILSPLSCLDRKKIDRIVRDRPIPIRGAGMQLTNISHVRNLSSMLTLAVENPTAASGNILNCASDRAVTLDGMAKICAQAAIMTQRPLVLMQRKPSPSHFYTEPRAAKKLLGYKSTTNLPEDLKEQYEEYVTIGRDKKSMQFELDDKILEALKVAVA